MFHSLLWQSNHVKSGITVGWRRGEVCEEFRLLARMFYEQSVTVPWSIVTAALLVKHDIDMFS